MIARELLGTAQVDGGEELLFSRGRDFMIVMGQNELMSARMRGSEEALVTMTLERLARPARMLIGGYEMGFTLHRARRALAGAHHGGRPGPRDHRMGARADGHAYRALPRRSARHPALGRRCLPRL